MNLNYQRHGTLPKSFVSLMRSVSLSPHANAGWPIRAVESPTRGHMTVIPYNELLSQKQLLQEA